MTGDNRLQIHLSRPEDLDRFHQARNTLTEWSPAHYSDPNYIDVARAAFDVLANGEKPPIRRLLTSSRVIELRVSMAEEMDADPADIPPIAAVADAVSHRMGACSSLDFLSTDDVTDIAGYDDAAAWVEPDAPHAALETIFQEYAALRSSLDAMPTESDCGHMEDYKIDLGDETLCMRCYDEKHRQDERELMADLTDGLGGKA